MASPSKFPSNICVFFCNNFCSFEGIVNFHVPVLRFLEILEQNCSFGLHVFSF